MESHVRVLAILHIVLGFLGGLAGLGILVLLGGIAGLVGLTAMPQARDAAIAIPVLMLLAGVICFVLLVLSVPSIVAGIGLLKFRPWARILTIVLSAIGLIHVPIGTAVGIYGLWVLLSRETEELFQTRLTPLRRPAQAAGLKTG